MTTLSFPTPSTYPQPQYVFIHDALCELITCGETDIAAPALKVKIQRLAKVVPGKGLTGFQEQFQVCIVHIMSVVCCVKWSITEGCY